MAKKKTYDELLQEQYYGSMDKKASYDDLLKQYGGPSPMPREERSFIEGFNRRNNWFSDNANKIFSNYDRGAYVDPKDYQQWQFRTSSQQRDLNRVQELMKAYGYDTGELGKMSDSYASYAKQLSELDMSRYEGYKDAGDWYRNLTKQPPVQQHSPLTREWWDEGLKTPGEQSETYDELLKRQEHIKPGSELPEGTRRSARGGATDVQYSDPAQGNFIPDEVRHPELWGAQLGGKTTSILQGLTAFEKGIHEARKGILSSGVDLERKKALLHVPGMGKYDLRTMKPEDISKAFAGEKAALEAGGGDPFLVKNMRDYFYNNTALGTKEYAAELEAKVNSLHEELKQLNQQTQDFFYDTDAVMASENPEELILANERAWQRVDAVNAEIAEANALRDILPIQETQLRLSEQHASLREDPDFIAKTFFKEGRGFGSEGIGDKEGFVYNFISGKGQGLDADYNAREAYFNASEQVNPEINGLDMLTPGERETFMYLYNTKSPGEAMAYLDELNEVLLYRRATQSEEGWREYASQNGWTAALGTLKSVPLQMLNAAMTPVRAIHTLAGGSPYASIYDAQRESNIYREVGGEMMGKFMDFNIPIIDKNAGELIYGVATSLADMWAAAGISTALGAQGLTTVILGSSAASTTMYNAAISGKSPVQAVAQGLISGVIEHLTEQIAWNRLTSMSYSAQRSLLKNVAGNIALQAGTEGAEEGIANLANLALSYVMYGLEGSDIGEMMEQVKKDAIIAGETLSEQEVTTRALLRLAQEFGGDVLAGAISGAANGAGVMALPTQQRKAFFDQYRADRAQHQIDVFNKIGQYGGVQMAAPDAVVPKSNTLPAPTNALEAAVQEALGYAGRVSPELRAEIEEDLSGEVTSDKLAAATAKIGRAMNGEVRAEQAAPQIETREERMAKVEELSRYEAENTERLTPQEKRQIAQQMKTLMADVDSLPTLKQANIQAQQALGARLDAAVAMKQESIRKLEEAKAKKAEADRAKEEAISRRDAAIAELGRTKQVIAGNQLSRSAELDARVAAEQTQDDGPNLHAYRLLKERMDAVRAENQADAPQALQELQSIAEELGRLSPKRMKELRDIAAEYGQRPQADAETEDQMSAPEFMKDARDADAELGERPEAPAKMPDPQAIIQYRQALQESLDSAIAEAADTAVPTEQDDENAHAYRLLQERMDAIRALPEEQMGTPEVRQELQDITAELDRLEPPRARQKGRYQYIASADEMPQEQVKRGIDPALQQQFADFAEKTMGPVVESLGKAEVGRKNQRAFERDGKRVTYRTAIYEGDLAIVKEHQGDLSDEVFNFAAEAAYGAGLAGSKAALEASEAAKVLGDRATAIYDLGKQRYDQSSGIRKARAQDIQAIAQKPGQGKLDVTFDVKQASREQKNLIRGLRKVMQVTGFEGELYMSEPGHDGRITAEQGSFDKKTGKFRFDINAGLNTAQDIQAARRGAIEYALPKVMGHEFTHYLKVSAHDLYQKYQDAVIGELGDKLDDLVQQKMERSTHGDIDYIAALDEVVADGSEMMLRDSKAFENIIGSDQGLWEKFKTWFAEFFKNIQERMSAMSPSHVEAAELMETTDGIMKYKGELQTMWDTMMERSIKARAQATQRTAVAEVPVTTEAPAKSPEKEQTKAPSRQIVSSRGTVYTADNQAVGFHYALLDINDLIASNNTDMTVNPDYPAELQPRDRTRVASRDQVDRIARNLNPERLGESKDVSTGAPIVGADNVVESGNGRVMALRLAHDRKAIGKYITWLRDNAAGFGLNPDDVNQNSVLVRVREDAPGLDRVDFVQKSNESTIAAYSDTEAAATDAGKMTSSMLMGAEIRNGELVLSGSNRLVSQFFDKVIPQNERAAFMDAMGNLSTRGLARIRNALFHRAYGDAGLTSQVAEVTDGSVKNVIKAMTNVSPRLAVLAEDVKMGRVTEMLPIKALVDAYNEYKNMKETDTDVVAYLKQIPMFEMVSDATKLLVEMFENNKRSAVRMTENLNAIIDTAVEYGHPDQMMMPGLETMAPSTEGIIKQGIDRAERDRAGLLAASERQYSERDTKYLRAVEVGDLKTAQDMVDDAADMAMLDSKIRDEEGKLIAVYHGTDVDFNVFDRSKSRANMDIQGNFFSPWEEDAAGYGRNVRKFYLNITNPATESIGYKALRQYQGQNNAGVKARDYLIQLGYDGVDNSGEEYIAFDSAQVKLADPVTYDDAGNPIPLSERFKDSSPDIRYSERDPQNTLPSARAILAGAFGNVAVTDAERQQVKKYQDSVAMYNRFERTLNDLRQELKELRAEGAPKEQMDTVRLDIQSFQDKLNKADRVLLNLQNSKPLKDVVNRQVEQAKLTYKEQADARVQGYRERNLLRDERIKARDYIIRGVKDVDKLLRYETDQKHIPEGFKGAAVQFIKPFLDNTSVFTYEQLNRFKDVYNALGENGDLADTDLAGFYDFDIAEDLKSLSETMQGRRLSDLSIDELNTLKDIVDHVKHIIKNENELFLQGKRQRLDGLGDKGIGDYRVKAKDKSIALPGAVGAVGKFLNYTNVRPLNFFNRIGSVMGDMFGDILDGQNKWAFGMKSSRAFFQDIAKKYNYNSWSKVKGDEFNYRTARGQDIKLTREQALALYATAKREQTNKVQNASHLEIGGFVYSDAVQVTERKKGIPVKYKVNTSQNFPLNAEDVANISNWLTAEQKAYADEMVKYLSEDMGGLGNEVSMQLYGIKKYGETYYFPYKSAGNYLYSRQGEIENDSALKHRSFSKRTVVKANNPIVLNDFTATWASHVQDMLMYNALVVPLDNFNRVYNYKTRIEDQTDSMKTAIEAAYGKDANEYIKQLMMDINGGVRPDLSEQAGRRLVSLFKKGAVFASLSVTVQQPSAIMRSLAMIDPKYFRKGYTKAGYNEMMKHSGVAIIKEMGRFDANMGRSSADWLTAREYEGAAAKTKALFTDSGFRDDALSMLPQKADEMTWTVIWEAVKREQLAKGGNPGSETFLQDVAKRFNEVIEYTQVYDSVLTRSQAMRSRSLYTQMVTSFMAEPTVSYNLLRDAIVNKNNPDAKIRPSVQRAFAAFMGSVVLNALLKSFVTAGRDDDENYTYLEKYLRKFSGDIVDGLNPLNLIPYGRDLVSLWQGYDVERADMSIIEEGVKSWKMAFREDVPFDKKLERIAGSLAAAFGLPVKNVLRDLRGTYNIFFKSAPLSSATPGTVKFSTLEGLPSNFFDKSKGAYYRRLYDAIASGNATAQADVRSMLGRRGDDDKKIAAGLRKIIETELKEERLSPKQAMEQIAEFANLDNKLGIIGAWYKEGDAGREETEELLRLYWKDDPNQIFKKLLEYDADLAGEEDYSTFNLLEDSIRTGENLRQVINDYLDPKKYGYDKSDVSGEITRRFKKEYIAASTSERAALKGRLLNALVLLGYDREKKAKDIDAWLK